MGLAVAVPFSRVTSNRPPIFGHISWHRGLYAFGVQMNPATLRMALAVSGSSSRLRGNRRLMSLILAFAERSVDINLI